MTKAIYKGTCQSCGSVQKLPKGIVANHGYTLYWGFFNGVCSGSRKNPYETHTDHIAKTIETMHNQIESIAKDMDQLATSTDDKVWFYTYTRNGVAKAGYYWIQVTIDMEKQALIGEKENFDFMRYSLRGSKEEIIKALNTKKINALSSKINQMKKYIAWQEERLAQWQLKDLVAIV